MYTLRMRNKLCSSRMKYGSAEAPVEVWKCVRKGRMGWPFSATVVMKCRLQATAALPARADLSRLGDNSCFGLVSSGNVYEGFKG